MPTSSWVFARPAIRPIQTQRPPVAALPRPLGFGDRQREARAGAGVARDSRATRPRAFLRQAQRAGYRLPKKYCADHQSHARRDRPRPQGWILMTDTMSGEKPPGDPGQGWSADVRDIREAGHEGVGRPGLRDRRPPRPERAAAASQRLTTAAVRGQARGAGTGTTRE
jgi:hypothetical protein